MLSPLGELWSVIIVLVDARGECGRSSFCAASQLIGEKLQAVVTDLTRVSVLLRPLGEAPPLLTDVRRRWQGAVFMLTSWGLPALPICIHQEARGGADSFVG